MEAGTLLVRTEAEARYFETTLMATEPSIKRAKETADAQGQSIAWHATDYTDDKLRASGFEYCASPTISCIYHEATTDQASWYEVVHVYAPSGFFESPVLDRVRTTLTSAANARFKFGEDESGRPISADKAPGSVFGETDVLKRGGKSMEGKMRMYGCHRRRAAKGESVPGRAKRWPARYGPKGAANPAIESTIHNLAAALTTAEVEFSPEAAESRRRIAEEHDPDAKFRVVDGDAASTPFSMSLSAGYVVSPHDDSGSANEFVGFVYPSTTPLPDGHEWLFVVGGCIHPLPKTPNEVVLIAVRGNGVAHGTLPTSSTEAHCANHPGIGSALVNKQEMVCILDQMKQPDALPAPSESDLTANRKRVKAAVSTAVETSDESNESDSFDESGDEGGARTWKESMLLQIANGDLPTTEPTNTPKSVRKALQAFTAKCGNGCIILATTPETYAALGVPDVKGRAEAGWMLHELVRRVPEDEKEVKLNLYPSGGGSTKYTWCVLSPRGRAELATAAHATTVAGLDSAVRSRSTETIRKRAMEELAAQGLHECPECCGPVLDPDDEQYAEKDALIQRIGKRGAVLNACECNSPFCVSGYALEPTQF